MPISLLVIVRRMLFLLLLCFVAPNVSGAQSEQLNGRWIATSIVSTGVIGERYWERVSPLQGNSIVIEGQNVQISQEFICVLAAPILEVWTNDMRTFGSFGGDWSQLGLEVTGSQGFEVYTWRIDCPGPDWPKLSIVTQPSSGMLLLGSNRVFAVLLNNGE